MKLFTDKTRLMFNLVNDPKVNKTNLLNEFKLYVKYPEKVMNLFKEFHSKMKELKEFYELVMNNMKIINSHTMNLLIEERDFLN